MTVKQWYDYLLEVEVTMEVVEADGIPRRAEWKCLIHRTIG